MIDVFRAQSEYISLAELLTNILEETGYIKELEAEDSDQAAVRIENIDELMNKIIAYEDEEEEPTLSGFLENVALVADIDSLNESEDYVVLMTLHSAKGLEFPYVYMTGMEDGLFPSYMTIVNDDPDEIEEERRLCYVAITRAQQTLTISHARQRMLYGRTNAAMSSRFLREIPEDITVKKGGYQAAASYGGSYGQGYTQPRPVQKHQQSRPLYTPTASQPVCLDLNKGDMVEHTAFGRGLVLSVLKMGGDALLEIAFDGVGTKKLMAKTASAHMKKV